MKRGFPRPQVHVDKCSTNVITDSKGRRQFGQGYGDRWDNKTYPIPYTAEENSISVLDSGRMRECAYLKRCVACGEPVPGEKVTVLYKDDKIFSESGPFHEKCARLTQAMCPHIAVNSGYRFDTVTWTEVRMQVLDALF